MTDTVPEQPPHRPDAEGANGPESPGESATHGADDEDRPKEIGGRKGPDPTRYGDWEKNGRCIDF